MGRAMRVFTASGGVSSIGTESMKKKLTIPLLVLALVLWGVILYRVLAGGSETAVDSTNALPKPQKAAVVEKPKADSLLLNYNDPFIKEADRKSALKGKSVSVREDFGGRLIIKKKTTI